MAPPARPPAYVHLSVPNRSLGPSGRRLVLGMLAATTLGLAAAAAAIGAWPVMPFAGLEVAAVWLAFRAVALHDGDFERIEVGEHEVRLEARQAARVTRFVAQRAWARLIHQESRGGFSLELAYAGRTEAVGRLLSDEGRRRLAAELRRRLAGAAH